MRFSFIFVLVFVTIAVAAIPQQFSDIGSTKPFTIDPSCTTAALQSNQWKTYLAAGPGDSVIQAKTLDSNSVFTVIHEADGRVAFKTDKATFMSARSQAEGYLVKTMPADQDWERYHVVGDSADAIALNSFWTGNYVSARAANEPVPVKLMPWNRPWE